MKVKEIIICTLWCVLVLGLFAVNYVTNKLIIGADEVYEIYLGGKVIGFVSDDNELYDMINNKQKDIKKEFNVKNVYPPSDFQIVKTNSYTATVEPVEKVYNTLSELSAFTIEGYDINIKNSEDKNITIKVLDKDIFDEAINTFIMAFIDEDEYNAYMENNQPEIETTGKIIEAMFFDETISIQKAYIGVDEKIFTDAKDLSQYLLFGDNAEIKSYTVKSGDTIASISNENKLNPKEFLVANPEYKSEDSILAIGDKVNITLIKPILSYGYDVNEVADQKDPFDEEIEYDYTKDSSYEVITTAGVNGVTRVTTKYRVVNGETLAGARIIASEELTKKVNQVTIKGRPQSTGPNYGPGTGTYVDTGTKWQWPTNTPYIITSTYDYRWGTFHDGIDISGTGCGSPIYAAESGTVYQSGWEPSACRGGGECIIIGHENGYYTEYAHMMEGSRLVFEGQQVQRGQQIGRMGATGNAQGCHLHFGTFNGVPWQTGGTFNPLFLWS